MSDDTTGVINAGTPVQSSSPEPQTVPIYRLNEEVAAKRALQEQLALAQQMLRQSAPAPRPTAPEVEPEFMKQLREENPAAYKAFKVQERKQREQSAATFQVLDQQDRQSYLMEFGQDGGSKLQEVEQKLEELRQRGIHHFNRGQIYLHLEGVDAVKTKRTSRPSAPSPVQNTPVIQQALAQVVDAPSSEPKSAGTLSGSSAPASRTESLEEMEKRLLDQEF